jgi:hypothetical protein
MKSRRTIAGMLLLLSMTLSSAAGADGGCLQGTWHYYDSAGRLVGEQTVGCGELDGTWGTVTARSAFTQGCLSSF